MSPRFTTSAVRSFFVPPFAVAASLLFGSRLCAEEEVVPGGFALFAAKVLTAADDGDAVIDRGVLVVRDGTIEAVGRRRDVEVPEGYARIDVGESWLMPGMIDLHNHIATGQRPWQVAVTAVNDMVQLTNAGLRASASVKPGNSLLRRGVAGGVTSALFIPGSGTNLGGQGVLLKTGLEAYEDMELRNPGSLKLAQSGNPEEWATGVGRAFMNWNTRNTFRHGLAYSKRWEAFEAGTGERPEFDLNREVFRDLYAKETQVSVHTQRYQVVLMTITMVRGEFGLDAYIDHGTVGGWRTGDLAEAAGVPAIVGPRSVDTPARGFLNASQNRAEGFQGVAAGYQREGHRNIGFNTDCVDETGGLTPPAEELSLQAAMALRYGMENTELESVRGLTIVPARAAGLGDRLGSLEVGKDADVLVVTGDPADPRNHVEKVFTNGILVYDTTTEDRLW